MPKHLPLLSISCLAFLGTVQAAIAAPTTAPAAPEQPATAACQLADAPGSDFTVQVPFEVVDGRIYVQARVNDRGPFRFAVDTGASGIGRADTTLTSALGLSPRGKTSTSDGVQTAAVDTVQLDSLALGGMAKTGVHIITRDYGSRLPAEARFHGIIARDFFADGLLVLDYPRKILSFSRTLSLPATGKDSIGYGRAFRIPVTIGGVRTEANLDTGANVGFVMPLAMYVQVAPVALAPLEPAGAATLTNTRIETWRARLPAPVTIGAASVTDVELRVSDKFPEMLVGAHVLQKFALLIDQRARRIGLCAR
jgi:predicted aspartyl protease